MSTHDRCPVECMTVLHLASGAFTRNQKQPPMHLSRRRWAGALVCVLCTYLTASFPLLPPKKRSSCTLSCAKRLGRCSVVCFFDPPRSLFPSSRCMPPCSCVPLLPPRRSMHQTWFIFPAPSARQASGLSRVGNGHFDLGIKGFLSEGNRFRPKKSKIGEWYP